jgi:hypothetical protein
MPYSGPGPAYVVTGPAGPGATAMNWQQPQQPGYTPYQNPPVSPHSQDHGPEHLKHDAHQYGQLMQLVNDIANGNADASRVMSFLENLDTRFWKGALVGMAAVLILSNDTVKNGIANGLSGVMGIFGKEKEAPQPE